MRDVICAMVSIGEFRMVLSLHMTSEKLLHGLIRKNTDPLPVLERRSTSISRTITRTSSSGTHSPMFFEYDDDNYNNGINNGINIDHNSNNDSGRTDTDNNISTRIQALMIDINFDSEESKYCRLDPGSSSVQPMSPLSRTENAYMQSFLAASSLDSPHYDQIDRCGSCVVENEGTAADTLSTFHRSGSLLFNLEPPLLPLPTENDVRAYVPAPLSTDHRNAHVLSVHVLSYVKGQEAIALWNILRADSPLGFLFITDAITAVHYCEQQCNILHAICFPRLYALKSLCYPINPTSLVASEKCLDDAHSWLLKTKEKEIWENVEKFNELIQPNLPGLRDLHRADTGEWVVLTVTAMGLCGTGNWVGGMRGFLAAQNELKEINDGVSMFQIKVLHAWALLLSGDLLAFQTVMLLITAHTKKTEEKLISDLSGTLLLIRYSLSCFYDSAESLLSNLKGASPFPISPASTPRSYANPKISSRSRNRVLSSVSLGMNGPHEHGGNIFIRVAEAFMISRMNPMKLPLADITILCAKIAVRTPCTYIGGMYLFFTALAALAVYERLSGNSEDQYDLSASSDCGSELSDFTEVDPINDDDELKSLMEGIMTVSNSLDLLSTRHSVLVYLARTVKARLYRVQGSITIALGCAYLEQPPFLILPPAANLPLGIAYLKMERTLCTLASFDASGLGHIDKGDLIVVDRLAKDSMHLFELYEADIEIKILQSCISNIEQLHTFLDEE